MSDDDNDIAWSIQKTADKTSESAWTVKQRLRNGTYRAKKAGRRTLVVPSSVRAYWDSLPEAKFAPPTRVRERA